MLNNMVREWFAIITKWVQTHEQRILRDGISLTTDQMAVARHFGVVQPEQVRILYVESLPALPPEIMNSGILPREQLEMLQNAIGLTVGHGIFICQNGRPSGFILNHELVHVAQYERLGGIPGFLEQYLEELFIHGYAKMPLEAEANRQASALKLN
jgi:hypothetical protein